ncbi:hypothetical protein [Streptomyces sp. 6N223]|uniref:hypothetical protein n=1 Tax=Streptomyces sp. 6N223 TaxID=3457412 RepID=UPI003FCEE83A
MSHNQPQQHQEPDPAGSTQMFQAFVNDGAPDGGRRAAAPAGPASASASGPRVGLIVGVVVAVAALAAVAWLALG